MRPICDSRTTVINTQETQLQEQKQKKKNEMQTQSYSMWIQLSRAITAIKIPLSV